MYSGRLDSHIYMSYLRDIIYFDQPHPLFLSSYTDSTIITLDTNASPIPRVAVNINRFSEEYWTALFSAVNNWDLSTLILVSDSNSLMKYVRDIPSDEWDFRKLLEGDATVECEEPRLHRSAQIGIRTFAQGPNAKIQVEFVVDWERRGRRTNAK